jgi:hypothetical protein
MTIRLRLGAVDLHSAFPFVDERHAARRMTSASQSHSLMRREDLSAAMASLNIIAISAF